MKAIKATSFFKKVTQAQAEKSPALESKIGQKRPDITWYFSGLDHENSADFVRDLESLKDEHVAFFLNKAIENYGRDLIAERGTNWEYVPSMDELTLEKAFDYYSQETSRKRTLTKQTAIAFGLVYQKLAPSLIQVTPAAAAMLGSTVLPDWTKYSADEKIRATTLQRLESFAAAYVELDDESSEAQEIAPHNETLLALIKAFETKEVVEISADAL